MIERQNERKGLFCLLFASPFRKETFKLGEIITWQLRAYISGEILSGRMVGETF